MPLALTAESFRIEMSRHRLKRARICDAIGMHPNQLSALLNRGRPLTGIAAHNIGWAINTLVGAPLFDVEMVRGPLPIPRGRPARRPKRHLTQADAAFLCLREHLGTWVALADLVDVVTRATGRTPEGLPRTLRKLQQDGWSVQLDRGTSRWRLLSEVQGQPKGDRKAVGGDLAALVRARDDFRCRACGKDAGDTDRHGRAVKLEIDHYIPRERGGSTVFGNLWTLCQDCNHDKRAMPPSGATFRCRGCREETPYPSRLCLGYRCATAIYFVGKVELLDHPGVQDGTVSLSTIMRNAYTAEIVGLADGTEEGDDEDEVEDREDDVRARSTPPPYDIRNLPDYPHGWGDDEGEVEDRDPSNRPHTW